MKTNNGNIIGSINLNIGMDATLAAIIYPFSDSFEFSVRFPHHR